MRVCVHIVGVNRSLSWAWPSIQQRLIRPLASAPTLKLEIHLLLISPAENRVDSPRTGETGKLQDYVPDELLSSSNLVLQQDEILDTHADLMEKINRVGDEWGDDGYSARNHLASLGAQQASVASCEHEPDLLIYCRPDVEILGRLPLAKAALITIFSPKTPRVFLPRWGRNGGENDRFAIVSASAAHAYFQRILFLGDFLEAGMKFHSEKFLSWSLARVTKFHAIQSEMVRVRLGGLRERKDLIRLARKREAVSGLNSWPKKAGSR